MQDQPRVKICEQIGKELDTLADQAQVTADPAALVESLDVDVKLGELEYEEEQGKLKIEIPLLGRVDLFLHTELPQYFFRQGNMLVRYLDNDPRRARSLLQNMKAELNSLIETYNYDAKGYRDKMRERVRRRLSERKRALEPPPTLDEVMNGLGIKKKKP